MVNTDTRTDESRTRDRLLRVVSQEGPVSITALVETLGFTETAVRRHVDNLHTAGLVESREASGPRRRGRPAKAWVLTEAGHQALASGYDDLAGEALRFLRRTGGEDAVHAFAVERMAGLEDRLADRVDAAGDDAEARTDALVEALNAEGYAASARPVGTPGAPAALTGVQLCQQHCPVPRRPRVPPAVRGRDRGDRPRCSAPTSSAWRPSPTATASAPPASQTPRRDRRRQRSGA